MKPGFALLLLSLAPAWCQIAKPAAIATLQPARAQGSPHLRPDHRRVGADLQ